MNRQPWAKPPRWWSPRPNRLLMKAWTPVRRFQQVHQYRVKETEIVGLDYARDAIAQNHGLLITPNHPGHADSYLLMESLVRLKRRCYVMTAWQVFVMAKRWERMLYRQHGCFSIDREGSDLRAYRQAVTVLAETSDPLAVFPEGDVYHLNDRVRPFRDGTGSMVLSAVKRGRRPVHWLPCAIRYRYIQDPAPELAEVMSQLEESLHWRPRPDLPLSARIYRFAEGIMKLKEIEYLGRTTNGSLPERIDALANEILERIEDRNGVQSIPETLPLRVKELRQLAIARQQELPEDDPLQLQLAHDLEDLFFVVQLYSYPGDYVAENATIERMAETVDKFEEDFLDLPTARIRGARRGVITFGEPIIVSEPGGRDLARQLTQTAERRVQDLLDLPLRSAELLSA